MLTVLCLNLWLWNSLEKLKRTNKSREEKSLWIFCWCRRGVLVNVHFYKYYNLERNQSHLKVLHFWQNFSIIIRTHSWSLNLLSIPTGNYEPLLNRNLPLLKMFFHRFSSVTNKTASIARNIITDIFQCKYVSGYGEKILQYLPKNGKYILYFPFYIIKVYLFSSGYHSWPLHNIRLRNGSYCI